MSDHRKIIWLASYPKSGNTWFRIFLANLLSKSGEPLSINELNDATIASSRKLFDDTTGIASSDLTREEIERLRPYVYDMVSENAIQNVYLKIHDAFIFTKEAKPLISETASLKAIYIIRNPLDIAVSLAHHLSISFEKSVEIMCNQNYAFCNQTDRLPNQLEQRLFSWSNHVKSWTKQTNIPVMVIRFEDMIHDSFNIFSKAVLYCDLDPSKEEVLQALNFSNFDALQKQEKAKGFIEKPAHMGSFFRKGKAGTWHDELSAPQKDKLIENHGAIMLKYGYINKSGTPLY